MPKSFIHYPTGLVGSALLLLRIALATALVGGTAMAAPDWMMPGTFVVAIALGLGLFTRIAAGLAMLIGVFIAYNVGGMLGASAALHAAASLALAMIGAGGYSIDGLRFGRRVITLDRQDYDPR